MGFCGLPCSGDMTQHTSESLCVVSDDLEGKCVCGVLLLLGAVLVGSCYWGGGVEDSIGLNSYPMVRRWKLPGLGLVQYWCVAFGVVV